MYGAYDAYAFGVPEFRHDGDRASPVADEIGAAGAVPRQGVPKSLSTSRSCRRCGRLRAKDRNLLRKSSQLAAIGGLASLKDGKAPSTGVRAKPFAIEFLLEEPSVQAASRGLHQESDAARHRRDLAHRRSRCNTARASTASTFDICVQRFSFSTTPGDSLRTYFSSQAAATKGSQNLAGISNPAIDSLVDLIIAAHDRPTLITACKALDRVIRAGRYWVPIGTKRRTGSPTGMSSTGRRKSRVMRAASPKPGGMMRTRRRSSSAAASHFK
jgi:microcin C transport system substrate-binding protein